MTTPNVLGRVSILVVDDNEDARDTCAAYLRFHGARVVTALDGAAALRAVAAEQLDVIVLDLTMPGLSGYDVIRALRGDPRTRALPIVVLSGNGSTARGLARDAGADAFLLKGCPPEELLGAVMRLTRRS